MTRPTALPKLPERVQSSLDELLSAIEREAAGHLVAVLVHGSAVRGEYKEGASDLDLVVVLSSDPAELLERLGNPLLVARDRARIEAMILRRDEIVPSADVFPIFYEELATTAFALRGANPFEGLKIADHHKRLRIEQELREARIRLRVAIADAAAGLLRKAGIVERKLKQLRSPLAALASLAGKPVSSPALRAVIDEVGAMLGVETKPLSAVREHPEAALEALIRLLDAAIHRVDGLEEGGAA